MEHQLAGLLTPNAYTVWWYCGCGRNGQRTSFSSGAPKPRPERVLKSIGRRAWQDHARRMSAHS